jgi:hypothetical protein
LSGVQLLPGVADPNTPWFAILEVLKLAKGWSVDEVVLGRTRGGQFWG